jgi:hypothetical protein
VNNSEWDKLLVNDAKKIRRLKKEGAKDLVDWIEKQQLKDMVLSTTNNEIGYLIKEKDLKKYLKELK